MFIVFYRRFYILLFLVWLAAVAGLVIFAVWGSMTNFLHEVRSEGLFRSSALVNATQPANINHPVGQGNKTSPFRRTLKVAHKGPDSSREEESVPAPLHAAKKAPAQDVELASQPFVSTEEPAVLQGIECVPAEQHVIVRLQTSCSVGKVTAFYMEQPQGLVVDLHGNWRFLPPRVQDGLPGFIRKIVLGRHDTYLRIVLYYKGAIQDTSRVPQREHRANGLDIHIKTGALQPVRKQAPQQVPQANSTTQQMSTTTTSDMQNRTQGLSQAQRAAQ